MQLQTKRWIQISAAVILLAVLFQTGVNTMGYFQAKQAMEGELANVTAHYRMLGETHVSPLLALQISDAEKSALEDIGSRMRALHAGSAAADIRDMQRQLSGFFSHAEYSTELQSNEHFALLARETGGYGEAGVLLQSYNQSAAAMGLAMQTKTGRILTALMSEEEPIMLYADGRERETKVSL